ncbi:MAG: family 16 glycoside hydrolase [Candidatus Brocadiia bacterium]
MAPRPIWLAAALALAAGPAAARMRVKHHYVDRTSHGDRIWSATVVADLDNDGRPDIVVARAKWGKGQDRRGITWYRNMGRADRWSERMLLARHGGCDCGAAALDVDRDGWTDIVTSGTWLRNPGSPGPGKTFEPHACGPGVGGHDLEAADLDGDGREEVVSLIQGREGGVFVARIPDDPTRPWKATRVAATERTMHAALSPRGIGDIDGDGDLDIAIVGTWLENQDGKGTQWRAHRNIDFVRQGRWGQAVRSWIADMDGDGRMDIVQSECDMPTARCAWFRNVRGDGSAWHIHRLPEDRTPGDLHSLAVADFDLDGDLDVYVDEMEHLHVPPGRKGRVGMFVWENVDGAGRTWRKHTLLVGLGGHQAQVADLDGDGDPDIVTRPYDPHDNANEGRMHISVLENLARRPDATGPGSGLALGGQAAPPRHVAGPGGFVPLFNGHDLGGWRARPGAWEARDGAIWCTGRSKQKNWLIWEDGEPADFELRLEFRFLEGNSGVQVRSKEIAPFMVRGYQVEVAERGAMGLWHHSLAPARHRSHLATAGQKVHIAPDGTKSVEQLAPPEKVQAAYREGEWNRLVVTAQGPRLVQEINGVVFAELVDEDAEHASRRGVVALQDHGRGTVVGFRNIRLRALPPAGPLAHWTFEEDEPGVRVHGARRVDGRAGLALRFDGEDDRAEVEGLEVSGEALTLAAWVRPERFDHIRGRDGRILSKATGVAEQDHFWMLSTWGVGKAVRLRFRIKTDGSTTTLVAGSGDLRPGVWTHVAAVYDGSRMALYKDGQLVGTTPKKGTIDADPQVPVWIGDNPPEPGSRPWAGLIDDVRIYPCALSRAHVAALCQAAEGR